jgi:ribosomal protein S18 acetylase RimI-like enzyme
MDTDIVRMGPEDAARLDRVAEDVFDAAIDPGLLAAYLADDRHMMVLAISGGVVVGQARGIVHLSPDQAPELYIDNMGVTPARQRGGIAGRMLDELLAWGREKGCTNAWLGTELDNVAARALYESRRFEGAEMVFYELGDGD